ncbi:MAG: type II toxin-antitoxin system HicA family toxin [Clostridia bacterium]|nr:type II toxin-antitoxin system HicA family toxin [Clostridia bacterium]
MGKKEKLIQRLLQKPKDFTYDEASSLLVYLGFEKSNKGKTSGSRVRFKRGNLAVDLHRPHPRKELANYQIQDLIDVLKESDLI